MSEAPLPEAARSNRSSGTEPLLGVVVIARNEEEHIRNTLDAVVQLIDRFPRCRVVLVDSASEDRTVSLARPYPISILRYGGHVRTAAAGRRIGFQQLAARYVLFVDGDCRIEPGWVSHAIDLMEAAPQAAVVFGRRRTVHPNQPAAAETPDSVLLQHQLGGNALYRSEALRQAGCFNPFIVSEEEAELFGRLQVRGYSSIEDDQLMITHYTERRDSVAGLRERVKKGFGKGSGQVLRASIRNGLFLYHARRFNRPLLSLSYVFVALLGLLYASFAWEFRPLLLWALIGAFGYLWLALRRRSVRSASYLVADWLAAALISLGSFFQRPRPPESFQPSLERIQ